MKSIKFTEEYLEDFFEKHFIEDDELFECLREREGTIKQSKKCFDNDSEHTVFEIKLMMKEF